MRDDPDVQRVVSAFQLGAPRTPVSGRSGDLLGRGTGSSLEFQEHREYMPGDDVRHLDWSAYGRTDSLMVRLYREEISPRCEVVLDMSVSMSTGNGNKSRIARQLTAVMGLLSGQMGSRPWIHLVNDQRPLPRIGIEDLHTLADRPFDAFGTLADAVQQQQLVFKRQAIRVVISDFLFPHDPDLLTRKLATGASSLWMIQLLTGWEAQPTAIGGRHLVDVESDDEWDLIIDEAAVERYLQRLRTLQRSLQTACRRAHAEFVTVVADEGLDSICRRDLVRAGMLRVR